MEQERLYLQPNAQVAHQNKLDLEGSQKIEGPDFNNIERIDQIFDHYKSLGIQSSNLHDAIESVKKMIKWRLSDEPINENENDEFKDPEIRKKVKCTIFLGYTSNLVSSGVREIIRYLAEHSMIDCIVTTTGGIEEDFIKCMSDFYVGQFHNDDSNLRDNQIMRIGNIFLKNENYMKLEDWFMPILHELNEKQKKEGKVFSPSMIIDYMGMKINNPKSVYYWCHKN